MHYTINAMSPIHNILSFDNIFVVTFFLRFTFLDKKVCDPIFSAPRYATALQSCKRRITVSFHPLYTCMHIYKWKTSDLHRRSYVKKYFRENKRNPQSYIILLECTFASIFSPQNVSGKPHLSPTRTCEGKFPHTPLPPLCAKIGLHPCSKRWTSFWIPHWQCIF